MSTTTLPMKAPTVRLAKGGLVPLAERSSGDGGEGAVTLITPILALDLGTLTGWALRWDQDHVTSGVQDSALRRGESTGMRMLRFRRWLRELLDLSKPSLVAYEQPVIHTKRRQRNVSVAHNLEGVLLAELEGRFDYVSPMPSEVKKHATGRGNADKQAMVAAARERWGRDVTSFDEADALCLLAWVLEAVGEAGPAP